MTNMGKVIVGILAGLLMMVTVGAIVWESINLLEGPVNIRILSGLGFAGGTVYLVATAYKVWAGVVTMLGQLIVEKFKQIERRAGRKEVLTILKRANVELPPEVREEIRQLPDSKDGD